MPAKAEYLNQSGSSSNGTDDREAHSKFWIAAYTRPKSERKAADEISKHGIKTFVPVQQVIKQWSDRKKRIDTVVIPNILFASITETEISIIRQNPLIYKILSLPGQKQPARIPSDQISRLEFMLKGSETPIEFRPINFSLNQNVKVIRGDLNGLIGSVEKISDQKTKLVIAIDLLGGAMVEINSSDLETISN